MKCRKCGRVFEKGNFCPECGNKIEVNSSSIGTSKENIPINIMPVEKQILQTNINKNSSKKNSHVVPLIILGLLSCIMWLKVIPALIYTNNKQDSTEVYDTQPTIKEESITEQYSNAQDDNPEVVAVDFVEALSQGEEDIVALYSIEEKKDKVISMAKQNYTNLEHNKQNMREYLMDFYVDFAQHEFPYFCDVYIDANYLREDEDIIEAINKLVDDSFKKSHKVQCSDIEMVSDHEAIVEIQLFTLINKYSEQEYNDYLNDFITSLIVAKSPNIIKTSILKMQMKNAILDVLNNYVENQTEPQPERKVLVYLVKQDNKWLSIGIDEFMSNDVIYDYNRFYNESSISDNNYYDLQSDSEYDSDSKNEENDVSLSDINKYEETEPDIQLSNPQVTRNSTYKSEDGQILMFETPQSDSFIAKILYRKNGRWFTKELEFKNIDSNGITAKGSIDGTSILVDFSGGRFIDIYSDSEFSGTFEEVNDTYNLDELARIGNEIIRQSEDVVREYETKQTYQTYENDPNSMSEYIFYDIDRRYLTDDEINRLTSEEARLAINEIAARHGRIFNGEEMKAYFTSKSWYNPYLTAEEYNAIVDNILNDYEQTNSKRLVERRDGKPLTPLPY